MANIIILELGDILDIRIVTLSTPTPNKMETVLITYIDPDRLALTNLDTGQVTNLPLADNRIVTKYGKHVTEIHLLSRNPLKGYALQHGLTAGKHICVTFEEVPEKLKGEILETKNDMITFLTEDTFEILHLNFGYQGLPKNENFEVTSILVVPPNQQQEQRKETLTRSIYNYLENHPSFQESETATTTGTVSISINELAAKIIQEVEDEGIDATMLPWIRRVIRNYIEMVNRQEGEDKREVVAKEEGEDDVDPATKTGEPIIGISSRVEMQLLENIHAADQLFRNEGIILQGEQGESEEDGVIEEEEEGKGNGKGKKRRRHKKKTETNEGEEERKDNQQHLLQRSTQLYHDYIAYPPERNPLYESLKHFNKPLGWVMPVVPLKLHLNGSPTGSLLGCRMAAPTGGLVGAEPPNGKVNTTSLPVLVSVPLSSSSPSPSSSSYPSSNQLSLTTYLETDPLCVLSMLTFPTSVMRYSRIYTPLTSLYETTSMLEGTHGLTVFQMLDTATKGGVPSMIPHNRSERRRSRRSRRKQVRAPQVIRTVYVGEKQPIDKQQINNYTLLEEADNPNGLDDLLQGMLEKEVDVERYLQAIPSQARGIGFSVYQLSRQLEPFQIYYDRLNVKQRNILERILAQRSKHYRMTLRENQGAFASLETSKLAIVARNKSNHPTNTDTDTDTNHYLQQLAPTDDTFSSLLNRVYEESTHFAKGLSSLSAEEVLSYMTLVDGGYFFNFCLSASKLDRNIVREKEVVPYAYSATLVGNPNTYVPPIPPNPSMNPLVTVLPEQPPPEGELDIPLPPHVSKVTVLPLGSTGKEYCKNIEVVKIYSDHEDLTRDNERTKVMTTLLPSVREVVNGDHAVLLQGGPEVMSYYLRENNRWREDVTLQDQLSDCLMRTDCVRDLTNKQCVSMKALSKYMNREQTHTTPQVSHQFLEYLQKNELKQMERSRGIGSLFYRSRVWQDRQHFQLGLTRRTLDNLVQSPHQSMFLLILTEKNFDKRQHEILNFCMLYTRPHDPHNNLELSHWRYCVAKGVPLVPTSLYRIAVLYLRTLENFPSFIEGMEQITAECGTLCNGSIVDKHTGFKIADCPLVQVKSEPFCYRVVKKKERESEPTPDGNKYLNRQQDMEVVQEIVERVTQKLGIDLSTDEAFIVRNVIHKMPPPPPLQSKLEIGKNSPSAAAAAASIESDRAKVRMYLTLGMMVIAIQTSIPGVVSSKTTSHCKAVYLGYPLIDDPQEFGTMDYVACGVTKAKRKHDTLWKGLATSATDRISDFIRVAIDTELQQLPEVQSRIKNKREHIEMVHSQKKAEGKTEHSRVDLKVVSPLHQNDRDAIMDVPTCKGLDLYRSKILEYSLGIEAEIQEIVNKNDCQDTSVANNAMSCFTNQKNIISTYLHGAADLTDRLYHLIRTHKARPMISGVNTKREYPQPDTGFSETTIYAAFVYQAKQDILQQGLGNASDSSSLESSNSDSAKNKKHLVKVFDTLEENIQRLKDAKISYTKVQFEDLLKARFRAPPLILLQGKGQQQQQIYPDPATVEMKHILHTAIAEVVAMLDHPSPSFFPMLSESAITHLLSAMNHKSKGLATYLSHANGEFIKNMRKGWMSRKSPEETEILMSDLGKAFHPNTFSTVEQFLDQMQEFIENITQVYPSILLNKRLEKEIAVPISWSVTSDQATHLSTLMSEKYEALSPWYENEKVGKIAEKIKKESRPLVSLMKKISQYYRLQQQDAPPVLLSVDAICLLFKYFAYSVYDQYYLLGEGVVEVAVVDRMMETFLRIFVRDKELVNQPPCDTSLAENRVQSSAISSFSKEEREVNKVLRLNKLGPFRQSLNNDNDDNDKDLDFGTDNEDAFEDEYECDTDDEDNEDEDMKEDGGKEAMGEHMDE